MKRSTSIFAALGFLILLTQLSAWGQAGAPPTFDCKEAPVWPAAIVLAEYPHFFYYCKNHSSVVPATNPTPGDIPIYLRNASTVRIVVMHINPVSQQVSVLIGSPRPFTEPDSSTVKSVFNVSLPSGASSPTSTNLGTIDKTLMAAVKNFANKNASLADMEILNNSPLAHEFIGHTQEQQSAEAKSLSPTMDACELSHNQLDTQIVALQAQVDSLKDQVNAYNKDSQDWKSKYAAMIDEMTETQAPSSTKFINSFQAFPAATPPQKLAFSTDSPNFESTDATLDRKDFTTVIGLIRTQAVKLHGSLTQGLDSDCQTIFKDELDNDRDYLEKVFNTTSSSESLLDTLTDELDADNTLRADLSDALSALLRLISNPENYTYITAIPPEDRTQDQVLVTVNVQSRNLSSITSGSAASSSGSVTPPAGPSKSKPAKTTTAPAASQTATAAANSTSFTLSFGAGPVAFESIGIVDTPLAQHSFATTTTTTTTGQPCSVTTTTGTYCIVDNAASGWRILPMAMASARFWAFETSNQAYFLVPNYFSAGATVKSTNTSGSTTSLEYLLGFSWAIPVVSPYRTPNLFATVGAYAGEVSQLGGGLKLGVQNGTAPTTLPISSAYKWKLGFAITYAFGSQGGNAKPAKTSTNGKTTTTTPTGPTTN